MTVGDLSHRVSTAASLTCVSPTWRDEATRILRTADKTSGAINQRYWSTRRFEPFVLHCVDILEGVQPDPAGLSSPYAEVLASWDDEEALAQALHDVCDYHERYMDDLGGDWDPEFDQPPFDLIACELIFIKHIRTELGLPTPTIDHPLVSVLGTELPIGDVPVDPLLERVEEAFDNCFR